MWVIFEGLDKAGKTTLEWEFLKATNFGHMVIDRGPAGYMTFDRLFDRCTFSKSMGFVYSAKKIMESGDFMVVYCFADKGVVDKRLEEHNETCPYDYVTAQKSYRRAVEKLYDPKRTLMLDTTSRSIEECTRLIVEKLKEVQQSEL